MSEDSGAGRLASTSAKRRCRAADYQDAYYATKYRHKSTAMTTVPMLTVPISNCFSRRFTFLRFLC